MFVLAQGVRLLTAADLQDLTLMLRDAPMWSLVDPLSGDVAGKIVLRDREGTSRTLDLWAADGDFWLRRASLLALIPAIREGKPDLVRFTRYADPMVDEREFFIRKAIGWVLREIAYKDPTWVAAWVTARLDRLAGVTFREAVRRLPEDTAERLTAEFKAAGGGRGNRAGSAAPELAWRPEAGGPTVGSGHAELERGRGAVAAGARSGLGRRRDAVRPWPMRFAPPRRSKHRRRARHASRSGRARRACAPPTSTRPSPIARSSAAG